MVNAPRGPPVLEPIRQKIPQRSKTMARKKARQATKKKAAPGANFSPEQAVEMHKAGKNVSEIAQAFGYPKGFGNNRVRNALMKAGAYKTATATATRKTAPAKAARKVAPAPTRAVSLDVPRDPETALQICLRTIDVNTSKLNMDEAARSRFARTLMGSIATTFGIHDFQVRKPVLVLNEAQASPYVMRVASA